MVAMRVAEYEHDRKASIVGEPLKAEQARVTLHFTAWCAHAPTCTTSRLRAPSPRLLTPSHRYERCTDLLVIAPTPDGTPRQLAHVAKADLEKAVAVAESQAAEGEVCMQSPIAPPFHLPACM